MSEGKKEILLGDCLELMPQIATGSIDMILCDLPYGTTACKWDTHQHVMGGVLIESDQMGESPRHPPVTKRHPAAIQAEIDSVENQLSPENLFWDGERPRGQAMAASRVLNRRLKALEQELRTTA
jgi:hypothetical protein